MKIIIEFEKENILLNRQMYGKSVTELKQHFRQIQEYVKLLSNLKKYNF